MPTDCGFMSHLTQKGHFRDILLSQSLGLILKTKSNTTKANMHPQQNILQHKMNQKKT